MAGITTYLSILTPNVHGLNSPIKRHHVANWIKKEHPKICCLQETHLFDRNKDWLRVKGWKKIYQHNGKTLFFYAWSLFISILFNLPNFFLPQFLYYLFILLTNASCISHCTIECKKTGSFGSILLSIYFL
jgi:hypothetical protein